MTLLILLYLVGLILLGFEVVVPGGILGILGVLSMAGGAAVAFTEYGTMAGMVAIAVALVLCGAMLWLEFFVLPKTAWGRRLFLRAATDGAAAPPRSEDLANRVGEALTALAPSGYVRIDGRRHEAFSEAGFLAAGTRVRVVRADNFRLIVTPEK